MPVRWKEAIAHLIRRGDSDRVIHPAPRHGTPARLASRDRAVQVEHVGNLWVAAAIPLRSTGVAVVPNVSAETPVDAMRGLARLLRQRRGAG